MGLGDDQVVDVEVVVVLGVGDRRVEALAHVQRDALAAELQLVQRPLHRQAADGLGDQPELARADADVDDLGHGRGLADAATLRLLGHDYFLFAFLSAAWP